MTEAQLHDYQCESEFIEGPMVMGPCRCADRRAIYADIAAERARAHAIDFQFQSMSEANVPEHGMRNPMGMPR